MRLNMTFCWITADLDIFHFASLLISHPLFNITPHCSHPMQKMPRIKRHFCSHPSFVEKDPNPWKPQGRRLSRSSCCVCFGQWGEHTDYFVQPSSAAMTGYGQFLGWDRDIKLISCLTNWSFPKALWFTRNLVSTEDREAEKIHNSSKPLNLWQIPKTSQAKRQ